jgi:hypothetical protein
VAAEVGPAAADDDLLDRRAADRTRLALAAVDEKAVLEAAARAVEVAEVVDRGAAARRSRRQRLADRSASSAYWRGVRLPAARRG